MKKLGFGLMRLPLLDENDNRSVDIETVKSMVDLFISRGFTYFDTAAPYHRGCSETAFREAVVKRYPRDAYTITDKLSLFMVNSEDELQGFFDAQLERLGLDYIDYYWLHGLNAENYIEAQNYNAFAFLQRLKAEGKVKHIGFSFHETPDVLEKILTEHPEMEYVQLQLNYLDWEDAALRAKECYEIATKHGKPVIVMEPVRGGALAKLPVEAENVFRSLEPGDSIASWAIRFAATQANVMVVLSGMSDMAQMEDNTGYMQDFKPLDEREVAAALYAAEIIRSGITIPCTACHYCTDGCPKHIAIPEYFAVYNFLQTRLDRPEMAYNYYKSIAARHGLASECIGCGQCEERCPQHLPIRENLKLVAEALEGKEEE